MELKPGYKRTEAGMIPEEWNAETLGPHVEITSGESPSLFRFENEGVPYFKVDQLNNNNKYLTDTPYFIRGGKKVPRGSLIFPKRGASILLNKVRILQQDSFMDTNLMSLTPNPSIHYEYLYYALTHIQLWRIADTTSIPQINNKHIIPLVIPLPSHDEQCAIAGALSDVDALIGALNSALAKKCNLKQAAMQQLLTGQTRLPGFRGEWAVKRLGDVGKCLRGVSYKGDADLSPYDTESTIRLLRANNIQNASVVISALQFVNKDCVSSQQVFMNDDILICMANGSKDLVGKAARFNVRDGYRYTFGAFMGRFRVNKGLVQPIFVSFLFQTGRYRNYISNLIAGSSINNLRPGDIESLEFITP